jgi:small lipoprotein (TIGR04452 family)
MFTIRPILSIFFFLCFLNCAVIDRLGDTGTSVKGSEAKQRIADSILQAEVTATSFWLSQSGMRGGATAISPLLIINGVLARLLYPYISAISDSDFFEEKSVAQCESDILTKGALSLGSAYESLAPAGALGPVRDAALLTQLESCNLTKSAQLINIPGVIKL